MHNRAQWHRDTLRHGPRPGGRDAARPTPWSAVKHRDESDDALLILSKVEVVAAELQVHVMASQLPPFLIAKRLSLGP